MDRTKGLFFFDNTYRPCPLDQQYIGVSVKKPLQRFQLMNEICYKKVLDCAGKHQVWSVGRCGKVWGRFNPTQPKSSLTELLLHRSPCTAARRLPSATSETFYNEHGVSLTPACTQVLIFVHSRKETAKTTSHALSHCICQRHHAPLNPTCAQVLIFVHSRKETTKTARFPSSHLLPSLSCNRC